MPFLSSMRAPAVRRALGTAWLLLWCGVLYLVASPWRALGGIESEFLRWLEWWTLCAGLALGFTIGRAVRDWARTGAGRSYARAARLIFHPPLLITACALVVLSERGERGPVGVVVTGFLAYWAGLDVAFGAVPRMEGKDYAVLRGLASDDDPAADEGPRRAAWDRF